MFFIGRKHSGSIFVLSYHFWKLKLGLYESLWTVTSLRARANLVCVNIPFLKNKYKQAKVYGKIITGFLIKVMMRNSLSGFKILQSLELPSKADFSSF